MLELEKDGIV